MRVPRIFVNSSLAGCSQIDLDESISRYLLKVLRLREQAPLTLFNGDGGEYPAKIVTYDKKKVRVQLAERVVINRESNIQIHLAIGLSRGERMDYIVQKSTEMGVNQITPLFTERCEVKLSEDRSAKRLDHWQKVAVSACEQSGRNQVPCVNPVRNLGDWLSVSSAPLRLLMHTTEDKNPLPKSVVTSVELLVGPEGGFSEAEASQAIAKGYEVFNLGPRILRTETAPIAALSVLQYKFGDLG